MLSVRTANIEWPLGNHPHWEIDNVEDEDAGDAGDSGLKSVAESLVILQSLRQSRDKWLTSTFPKFSSKSRGGKPADVVPPPHIIHNRGKCDIEIGPHIFQNTVIFEVHYQYVQSTAPKQTYAYPPPPGQTSSWQATTPYGSFHHTSYGQRASEPTPSAPPPALAPAAPATTEASGSRQPSTPLLSSLGSSVSITPALISQVNSAASSNATLASLLQLAASGKATPEELKSLGLLIQSLAAPPPSTEGPPDTAGTTANSTVSAKTPTAAPSAPQASSSTTSVYKQPTLQPVYVPLKEFDIVLEFSENSSDRWILPRAPVVVERVLGGAAASDILLTMGIPFANSPISSGEKREGTTSADDASQQLATFRLVKASLDIWNCVSRWAGAQDKMDITRKAFERLLAKEPGRFYLAHQIPAGALLSQIQNSAMPPYTMKSIRQVQIDNAKPKRVRKPAARKPVTDKHASTTEPQKRKRQPKVHQPLPKIACVTCGQTDIPLIMGGRYCRTCAPPEMPAFGQAPPPSNNTFIHKFWAGPKPDQVMQPPVAVAPPSQSIEPEQETPKRKKSTGKSTVEVVIPVSSSVQQVDLEQSSKRQKSK